MIHYSDHILGQGKQMLAMACEKGLEGIVSKNINSVYRQARTEDWLKIKCHQRQELVIVGYTDPSGKRKFLGSLLLAFFDNESHLVYCGHVGTGFTQKSLQNLYEKLIELRQTNCPLYKTPPRNISQKAHWVSPKLITEVEFSSWTDEGYLRHPSFKGLREDKPANKVHREFIKEDMMSESWIGQLSHPDKVLYSKQNITKLDLARYYLRVADRLIPHIKDRPISLLRCPNEKGKKCFYQKHWNESFPRGILPVMIEEKSSQLTQYTMINNADGLVSAAQLDILELHPWSSRHDKLNQPDRIIFDLDPSPEIAWKDLVSAAMIIIDALTTIELESFIKLTGGKGLHIVVPIKRTQEFPQVKYFAKSFAEMLANNFPQLFTASISKAKRVNKIFIDYLRNEYGATAVAPFSPRANDMASIAVPVRWQHLKGMDERKIYTLSEINDYFHDYPQDPWRNYFSLRQGLNKYHLELFKVQN